MTHLQEAGVAGCVGPLRGVTRTSLLWGPGVGAGRTPAPFSYTGDSRPCKVLPRDYQPTHLTCSIPCPGQSTHRLCVPGYTGHIHGKVAENVHGGTFRTENGHASQMLALQELRRTMSAPTSARSVGKRGLSVPPRVPGFAGTVPGDRSESVVGLRFAMASEAAADLRKSNPHITSEGWLRRGQWPADRAATYKWNNRFSRQDGQDLFTEEQEQEAYESNRKLGQTFGLKPRSHRPYKPGDRYLHSLTQKVPKEKRTDPTKMMAAGEPSHSIILDGLRWRNHYKMAHTGNLRTF